MEVCQGYQYITLLSSLILSLFGQNNLQKCFNINFGDFFQNQYICINFVSSLCNSKCMMKHAVVQNISVHNSAWQYIGKYSYHDKFTRPV